MVGGSVAVPYFPSMVLDYFFPVGDSLCLEEVEKLIKAGTSGDLGLSIEGSSMAIDITGLTYGILDIAFVEWTSISFGLHRIEVWITEVDSSVLCC